MYSILYLYLLIFIIYFTLISSSSSPLKNKEYTINDIPNPQYNPIECGRDTVKQSSICDPSYLLNKDEKDLIEGYINLVQENNKQYIEIGVLIIPKIKHINYNENIETLTENFAISIHNQWGIGDIKKQNGILIFISLLDRSLYISVGKNLLNKLTNKELETVIEIMKINLRQNEIAKSIENSILSIDNILLDQKSLINQRLIDEKQKLKKDNNDNDWISPIFLILMILLILSTIYLNYQERKKINQYTGSSEKLNNLLNKLDNKYNFYEDTSCPICLEEFPIQSIKKLKLYYNTLKNNNENNQLNKKLPENVSDELLNSNNNNNDLSSSTSSTSSPSPSTSSSSSSSSSTNTKYDNEENNLENNLNNDTKINDETPLLNKNNDEKKKDNDEVNLDNMNEIFDKIKKLPCGHIFCTPCLQQYLSSSSDLSQHKCPICKQDINSSGSDTTTNQSSTPTLSNHSITARNLIRRIRQSSPSTTTSTTTTTTSTSTYTSTIPTTTTSTSTSTYSSVGTSTITQTTSYDQIPLDSPYIHDATPQEYFNMFSPDISFRINRLHYYYPSALDLHILRSLNDSINNGNLEQFRHEIQSTAQRLTNEINIYKEKQAAAAARSSGSSGSSYRFSGGGSSGGGRGGRW